MDGYVLEQDGCLRWPPGVTASEKRVSLFVFNQLHDFYANNSLCLWFDFLGRESTEMIWK